nr:UDP-4-amino-4,6-dideoxy-N-acetyl-beta-L-altrosamine transaminase [Spirochaeta sp.]
ENDFPTAFKNFRTSLSLPIYPGLTDREVERVIEAVKDIGSNYYQRRNYGA